MKNKTKPILFLLLGMGVLSAQDKKPSKKMGIETSNPQATLHVNGTVRLAEPGDYDPRAVLLGRHKDTKQLVALKPTQFLFSTRTLEQDYTKSSSLKINTGLYAEDVEVIITNARLVEKETGDSPVQLVYSIGSDEYRWKRLIGAAYIVDGTPTINNVITQTYLN